MLVNSVDLLKIEIHFGETSMVHGRKLLFGALLGLVSISGVVGAQPLGIHASPETGTFTLRLPDGTIITADAVSRRFYLTDSSGAFREVTFEEAISHAEPDPAQRAALMGAFESALINPIASGYQAHPAQPSPPLCWDSNECHPNAIGEEGEYGANNEVVGDDELPKPVDIPPMIVTAMRPSYDPASLGVNYWLGFMGGYANPGEDTSYQQSYADDYRRFQNQQQAACRSSMIASFEVTGAVILTGAACSAAVGSGGFAAAGCAGAAILTMTAWARMAVADAQCAQEYPGPGNW